MKHEKLEIRNPEGPPTFKRKKGIYGAGLKLGHAGLTLIEILLAVGITAVLGVGIAALAHLYLIYAERLPYEQLRAAALRDQQFILESLKRDIRESGEILATTTIDFTLYATATTTLVLQRRAIDANGFVLVNRFDRVVYTLSGASAPYVLRKIVEPAVGSAAPRADLILSRAVKELAFSYNHAVLTRATAVGARLIIEKTAGNRSRAATSTIQATLH
jgi:hypothetical protein